MPQVILIPRQTGPQADGIRIECETSSPLGGPQPVAFNTALFNAGGSDNLALFVGGKEAFKVAVAALDVSGAGLLAARDGANVEILSGRLILKPIAGGWPQGIVDYLNENWFADLNVVSLAVGNDGLQLESNAGGPQIFRWTPVRITSGDPVFRARWLELKGASNSFPVDDIQIGGEPIRRVPLREGQAVVESYLQRTTLAVDSSRLVVERPNFGLNLLGRDWFPDTCWSWKAGGKQVLEFVDINPVDWEPPVELEGDLKAEGTTSQKLQLTQMPTLLTTGRTTNETSELPAAWQYATININSAGSAPGVWVHWNLSPTSSPSRLAVQTTSLDSKLHGLWSIEQLDWKFEFGLQPRRDDDQAAPSQHQAPPRIRLRLTQGTALTEWSATLVISGPQIFGGGPRLQFFGRAMTDVRALPHAPELVRSLTMARIEFANVESSVPDKLQVSATLDPSNTTHPITYLAGPQAVEAWVPGPWAGLTDVSPTGANLPADLPDLSNQTKLDRDRNQGLVDMPLGRFSLQTSDKTLAQIEINALPTSRRTGPTVATLLPWSTWTVKDANTQFDVYHRNLQLEHFEQQLAQRPGKAGIVPTSEGIMLYPVEPPFGAASQVATSTIPRDSDDLLRVEMEYDRVRAVRDRFAQAAGQITPGSAAAEVKNWFHAGLGAQVGLERSTDLKTPPQLKWNITPSAGEPANESILEVGSDTNILEAGVEWLGAVVQDDTSVAVDVTQTAPKLTVKSLEHGLQSAGFLTSNGHVPPIFRTASIRCLDAADIGISGIGQALLVVYVDNSERMFAWFPGYWKQPRQLTAITGSPDAIRIVLTAPTEVSTKLPIVTVAKGVAKVWNFPVARGAQDLPDIGGAPVIRTFDESDVTALHATVAQIDSNPKSMLLIGTKLGGISFYSRQNILEGALLKTLIEGFTFGSNPIDRLDFRNQAETNDPKTQALLAGTHDSTRHLIHVAVWDGNDLIEPDSLKYQSANPPTPAQKCPSLIVADGMQILGMALQGFDGPEGAATAETDDLYVWGIIRENDRTQTCQWKLSLPATDPGANVKPKAVSGSGSFTGFLPAGLTMLGDVAQLGFGDRTDSASRFLVAVTTAGAGQISSWMRWEPDWDRKGDHVPSGSFFPVAAHHGRITGASVVPSSNVMSAKQGPRRVVLATGGDDGAIIVWDVASGQELYRWQPRDWFVDLGGLRLATPKGNLQKDFYVERVALSHVADAGEYIVLSTSPPDSDNPPTGATSVPLATPAPGTDLNFICHNLLLRRDGTTNNWNLAKSDPLIATPLGMVGIYGKATPDKPINISSLPSIGHHPFYPTDAIFTFLAGDPLKNPRPQQIVIRGVLLNLADIQDVIDGQVPWFVNRSEANSILVQVTAAAGGQYEISDVSGHFDWTFPLTDQLPPPSVARSVPGRLQSLSGNVSWDAGTKSMQLTVDGGASKGDALGRTWSLTQQIKLKLESSASKALILRESLDSAGTLLPRRTLPHLRDESHPKVIELGRGPDGELLALTASDVTPGDLFVSEVDTGRRVVHCQDRYRGGVLVLREPNSATPGTQDVDAVLIHVDGTVRVWPAFGSSTGPSTFSPLTPQSERRRLQPDSAVEEVVVFAGPDKLKSGSEGTHRRHYLLRCADGSARLWDDVDGEIQRFDLPGTTVTAIAIAPTLGEITFGELAKLHPKPDSVSAVTTVVALGGADGSVRCYLIESDNPELAEASVCFFEDHGDKLGLHSEVTSVSLASNPQAVGSVAAGFTPGLFLLACSRNGEQTSAYELLSGLKPLEAIDSTLKLAPVRARLATSGNSLFIAAETATESGTSVEIYEKDGGTLAHGTVADSSGLATLAISKVESSSAAIFAAAGKSLQAVKLESPDSSIDLDPIPTGVTSGDQAISLISVPAGNALLAIDHQGQAKLFLAKDVSPLNWDLATGFDPSSSQQVIAATSADTIVPVALRVSAGRIEVWDLDFDSRRWTSPAKLGNFAPQDLASICFQFLNGRPILAVGRFDAVEFWNLENGQLEHRLASGGKVVHLDLKISDLGEPQILMAVLQLNQPNKPLEVVRATLDGQLAPQPVDDRSEFKLKFVRGSATNLAVLLERLPNTATPTDEILRVTYLSSAAAKQVDIKPGVAGAEIKDFDAVSTGGEDSKIVLVVKSGATFSSWVFDSTTTTAAVGAPTHPAKWMILDSTGTAVEAELVDAQVIQAHEFKPDRTVRRKLTINKWITTETIGNGSDNIITRSQRIEAEDTWNLRLVETNWPATAAISTSSDIRLWDRLTGVLRQTWRAEISIGGTKENLKPLAKGLLGIPSGSNPSLVVAGEQGLVLYRFRFGGPHQQHEEKMQQVALGWEPTATTFPLIAAWNDSAATTCRADTLANFINSPNSVTTAEAALTELTLSWQPAVGAIAKNSWHLSGNKGPTSIVYALQHPAQADPTKAHELGSSFGRILAMAWPTEIDQGPVRVISRLRPDQGPRRDVTRLLLAVDDSAGSLELRDMVVAGWTSGSAWKVATTTPPAALSLVDDDLGVRLVAPPADQHSGVMVLAPTPWLRISSTAAPQLDLRVKLADPAGTLAGVNNFIGRITRDRHFELDIKVGTIPEVKTTLVARPVLVQGDAYTFNVEPVADTSSNFLRGAMVLWETSDPQAPAGLQGTLIWETCETSAAVQFTPQEGNAPIANVTADLRAFTIATISQSQVGKPRAYVTGTISHSPPTGWELHLAEQPLGAAFAFLFQADMQGFVPAEITAPSAGQPWKITVSKTLFAAEPWPANNVPELSSTPQVRDDVFLPLPTENGSVGSLEGRVVDLRERPSSGLNASVLGVLTFDTDHFAFRKANAVDGIPLDLLGGIDSTVAIPKQGMDIPQLVHRRDLGGRLRALRDGLQPLSLDVTDLSAPVGGGWINPVMTQEITPQENRAAVLFESLAIKAGTSAPPNTVGLSLLRTESVMVLTCPEFLNQARAQTTDIARNLLTATTSASFGAGVPRTIFNDDVIRSHAVQVGATGILLKRTLDTTGLVEFTFVNSPYHALEPQTLSGSTALASSPGTGDEDGKVLAPQWVTPRKAAEIRQIAATKRFELVRPTTKAALSRTLRLTASPSLAKLQNQKWRIAVAEHTLFEDFDCIDEDDPGTVKVAEDVFLPTDVTLRYGVDKPGATQVHQVRAVTPETDGFARSQSTLATLREPQQIKRPNGSNVTIIAATLDGASEQAIVPGVTTLRTNWEEAIGSEPIGALAEDIKIAPKDGSSTPQYEITPLNSTGGDSSFPPIAVFERVGERVIAISPSAPVLVVADGTADKTKQRQLFKRLSVYLVSKFDLSKTITLDSIPFRPQILFKKGSTLTLKPLSEFFEHLETVHASTSYYLASFKPNSEFWESLSQFDNWNIAWAQIVEPVNPLTVARVFKVDGTIQIIEPSELHAARLAAVWRSAGNDLFGNTIREQTAFYGESASSQSVTPTINGENFELIAKGSEKVGVATTGVSSHLFVIKTLGNGETLRAGSPVSPG